ncbi:MAG: nickel-dependent lactate racemase [Promethearchaeota archaeon]
MIYQIAYGQEKIKFNLSDELNVDIFQSQQRLPIENPKQTIIRSFSNPLLSKPLNEILSKRKDGYICVVISDSTRPIPNLIILDALMVTFNELNIPDEKVKILIANGMHRKCTPKEIKEMIGKDVLFKYDIINHDANDDQMLEYLGETELKTPIYINRTYLESSIKIITGLVEPHFFAGFSGGRKSIVPGIAGKDTILGNHCATNINSPYTRFGIIKDNPVFSDADEILKMKQVRPDFMINVCINPEHQITKIISGSYRIYNELVKYQKKICFRPISELYDVVITGNGGYPLDRNLYQAVKSMAIGEMAVKKGGTIISVNECRDGIGSSSFEKQINLNIPPDEIQKKILEGKLSEPDQWQTQILARILSKANIYVISSISHEKLGNIGLKYASDIETAISECIKKYGSKMRVLILPDGPEILPIYHRKNFKYI